MLDWFLIASGGLSSWFGDLGSTLFFEATSVVVECVWTISDLYLWDHFYNVLCSLVSIFSGRFENDMDSSFGDGWSFSMVVGVMEELLDLIYCMQWYLFDILSSIDRRWLNSCDLNMLTS